MAFEVPRPRTVKPVPPDPDELMSGRCPTCGWTVECARSVAAKAFQGSFLPMPYAECLCGARVHVTPTGRRIEWEEPRAKAKGMMEAEEPGVIAKMLGGLRRGEDVEFTAEDDAEMARLEAEEEGDQFMAEDLG